METLTQKTNQIEPFLDQREIPIDRNDIRLEQGLVDDPDVLGFVADHRSEFASGKIRIDNISKMTPREAVVYKLLHRADDESDESLAGLIYLVKKGMEYGSLQIAYVLAKEYQDKKQGIATSSVGAVTKEVGKKYGLVANIDNLNERSMKLAKRLGYFAIDDVGASNLTPHYKTRSSGTERRDVA